MPCDGDRQLQLMKKIDLYKCLQQRYMDLVKECNEAGLYTLQDSFPACKESFYKAIASVRNALCEERGE